MRRLGWLVAFVVLFTGCLSDGDDRGDSRRGEPVALELADVAELAHLEFPEGAGLESTTYQAFQDWHLTALVTFPAEQLDAFATHNNLELLPDERPVRDSDRPDDDPEWAPDGAVEVLGEDAKIDGGPYRRLLIDTDDPAVFKLYLVAFTT